MASAYRQDEQATARPLSGSKAQFSRKRRFSYEAPERLKQLEKGFLLDGVALSHNANDETGRTQPSLNLGIPQYIAAEDKYCQGYFARKGLPKAVKEETRKTSMQGQVFDKFLRSSEAKHYLTKREGIGAGYTRRLYGGHLTVPTLPSKDGYNGPEGYRRNTPDLRSQRSPFDYEDPFDNPKPTITLRARTQSAPAGIRLMRLKSARAYQRFPGGRRIASAMPAPSRARELVTGPQS